MSEYHSKKLETQVELLVQSHVAVTEHIDSIDLPATFIG